MATKTGAKAAVDSAGTQIKADIDNILPVGVNIVDGIINFGPIKWTLIMDAGGSQITADSWATTIGTNLGSASRTFTTTRSGRRNDDSGGKFIRIESVLAIYLIRNF